MAVGANTICTLQEVPTASVWPAQLSVSVKSPVTISEPKMTGAVPVLLTVMVCAADCVATCCAAKVRLVAESVMAAWLAVVAVSSGVCHSPRP